MKLINAIDIVNLNNPEVGEGEYDCMKITITKTITITITITITMTIPKTITITMTITKTSTITNLVDPIDIVNLNNPEVGEGERGMKPAVGVHNTFRNSLNQGADDHVGTGKMILPQRCSQ